MKEQLDRVEKDGVVQKVTTATGHCAPVVPVKFHICVDFKKLNQNIKRPHLMLSNLEDDVPKLSGSKVCSTLD